MPIYAPRTEPVKKLEELAKREADLISGIKKKKLETHKLLKLVSKYRKAQLSMLKAKIHKVKENEFQKKPNNVKIEKLEKLTIEWIDKTDDDIIIEIRKANDVSS